MEIKEHDHEDRKEQLFDVLRKELSHEDLKEQLLDVLQMSLSKETAGELTRELKEIVYVLEIICRQKENLELTREQQNFLVERIQDALQYSRRLFKYNFDVLECDSLMGQIYLDVLAKLHKYRGKGSFTFWLRKVIYGLVRDYYRRDEINVKESDVLDESIESRECSPSYQIETNEEMKKLLCVMNQRLTKEEQMLLELYYYEKLTTNMISKLLHVPESNISRRLHQIREKIKNHWGN